MKQRKVKNFKLKMKQFERHRIISTCVLLCSISYHHNSAMKLVVVSFYHSFFRFKFQLDKHKTKPFLSLFQRQSFMVFIYLSLVDFQKGGFGIRRVFLFPPFSNGYFKTKYKLAAPTLLINIHVFIKINNYLFIIRNSRIRFLIY